MRLKNSNFSIILLVIILFKISSTSIIIPKADDVLEIPVSIPSLRGYPPKQSEAGYKTPFTTSTNVPNKNNNLIGISNYPISPIKFEIEGGEEDDVDSNSSNVDGSDDLGIESNFNNAQGTAIDSQFMQIQESQVVMPPIEVQGVSTFSMVDTNSSTFNHTISGNNRLLVVSIGTYKGEDVANVTFAGQLLTFLNGSVGLAGWPNVEVWYLKNPSTGTYNGTVTMTGGIIDDIAIGVVSYSGVDQTTPIDVSRVEVGKSKETWVTVPSRSGDLVQDVMANMWGGIPTESVNQTARWKTEMGASGRYSVGSTQPGAPSVTFNWTLGTVAKDWVNIGFNIRKAPAPFVLDLEYQWTDTQFSRQEEELAIYTGSFIGTEPIHVDVWTGESPDPWVTILTDLDPNAWNNVSVHEPDDYLTSSTFTIRFKGADETLDSSQGSWNIDLILLVVSAENTPPSVNNITFSPEPFFSNETLYLNYNYTDIDGDPENIDPSDGTQIRWYKDNGTHWVLRDHNNKHNVSSDYLHKGDIWRVTIRPHDGEDYGNITTSENITIQNTPPTVSNVYITPSSPKTSNDLIAYYKFDDYDSGDTEENSIIRWYRNGSELSQYENMAQLPANETMKGWTFYFNITPSDGTHYGSSVLSSEITISNTAPALTVTINGYSVPTQEIETNNLTADYSYYDADLDSENTSSIQIQWYLFNLSAGSWSENYTDTLVLQSGNTSDGDLWKVEIRISDGTNYSVWTPSATISIGEAPNSPPSAFDVHLNSSNPVTGGYLYANYTYQDNNSDNEGPLTQFKWYWWNGTGWQEQTQFDLYTRNLTDAILVKGEKWKVSVRPQDEKGDYGEWNTSLEIIILNSAPEVSPTAAIFPAIAYTFTTLEAIFSGDDIDGDNPLVEIHIVWLNNSELVPSLNDSTEVSSSYTRKGQNWTFTVWISDGENWSQPLTFSGIIIQNSEPRIENITLSGGQNTTADIHLSYDFLDPDGDPDLSVIVWVIFHINPPFLNLPGTITLSNTEFMAGDLIWVKITPDDDDSSTDTGSTIDTSYLSGENKQILVGNAIPTIISGPSILDYTGSTFYTVSNNLKVNYTGFDPDTEDDNSLYGIEIDPETGYVIDAQYRWYRNGELISELIGPVVDKSYLQKDDKWIVSVKPKDELGYGSWYNSSEISIVNSKMEIISLGFIDNDTYYVLTNSSYANVTISLEIGFYDPDFDNLQNKLISWFLDNGNGTFSLLIDLINHTAIPSSYLEKDYRIKVCVSVFDGEEWSNAVNSSIIYIINSPPTITSIEYIFNENEDLVQPVTRTTEFFIEDEDINFKYNLYDNDLDEVYVRIQWLKQSESGTWTEITDYENKTVIPSNMTEAGEKWCALFTLYDGTDFGSQLNSSLISIISRPNIYDAYSQADDSMDVRYNLIVNASDYTNPSYLEVDFVIIYPNGSSITLSGSKFGLNHWNQTIDFLSNMNEIIIINISVFTRNGDYTIFTHSSFSFNATDVTAPRVREISVRKDNEENPSFLIVEVSIEEFASNITKVLLHYSISNQSAISILGLGSGISEEIDEMQFQNISDGLHWYKVNLPYNFAPDVIIDFWVETIDGNGNIRLKDEGNDENYFSGRFVNLPPAGGLDPLVILIAVVLTVIVFLAILGGVSLSRRRSTEIRRLKTIAEKRVEFLTGTYSILITSSAGVPIWSLTNVIYRADESLTGVLSGLSVSIDSFLESFQADFMSQIGDGTSPRENLKEEAMFKVSAIEQNKVHILIVGSISFRIFIFSKNAQSTYMRERFLDVIKAMQKEMPLQDLGVIDEEILGPYIEIILRKHIPINLLLQFRIDVRQLNQIDRTLRTGIIDVPISLEELNQLKLLVASVGATQSVKRSRQALLARYNQIYKGNERDYSDVFIFFNSLQVLENINNTSRNIICDAFYAGTNPLVNIIRPVSNSRDY